MPTISAWVFIVNLCAFAAMACLLLIGDNTAENILAGSLWLGGPYLGHCGLALTCRRDRGASAVVLAWTLVSLAIAFGLLFFPPAGIASADGQDYENGYGFVILGLPVLQWISIVVLGIVLLLSARGRASGPPLKPKIPPLGDLD